MALLVERGMLNREPFVKYSDLASSLPKDCEATLAIRCFEWSVPRTLPPSHHKKNLIY